MSGSCGWGPAKDPKPATNHSWPDKTHAMNTVAQKFPLGWAEGAFRSGSCKVCSPRRMKGASGAHPPPLQGKSVAQRQPQCKKGKAVLLSSGTCLQSCPVGPRLDPRAAMHPDPMSRSRLAWLIYIPIDSQSVCFLLSSLWPFRLVSFIHFRSLPSTNPLHFKPQPNGNQFHSILTLPKKLTLLRAKPLAYNKHSVPL